jgi:hypothetical protein
LWQESMRQWTAQYTWGWDYLIHHLWLVRPPMTSSVHLDWDCSIIKHTSSHDGKPKVSNFFQLNQATSSSPPPPPRNVVWGCTLHHVPWNRAPELPLKNWPFSLSEVGWQSPCPYPLHLADNKKPHTFSSKPYSPYLWIGISLPGDQTCGNNGS